MKMVKSLLLGSAAGVFAVAGAQAADLPVKAKPVEYVKVCSLYGAGYYYMPGTDICIKLGGYIRWQANGWTGANMSAGPINGPGGRGTRTDSLDFTQRTRAVVTVDTRQQTAYGTLRTYVLLGYQQDSVLAETTSPNVYMTRGFIQIAGFTFGKATSFTDIFPNASFAYLAGNNYSGDSGDAGKMLAAYTAQFGNGFSGTIAIEQSRRGSVAYLTTTNANAGTLGGLAASNHIGGVAGVSGLPDLVLAVRLDQAWGTLAANVAFHNASGGYYGAPETNGHPSEKWGFFTSFGGIFNLPFITPGDRFAFQVGYSEGATRYHAATMSGAGLLAWNGGSVGWAMWEDAVYGCTAASTAACNSGHASATDVQLTTAFSVIAAFEHLWTPALRTSWYGSYIKVTHNGTAVTLLCTSGITSVITSATTCNPDWEGVTFGSRTHWEPLRGLTLGVDILYHKLKTATANNTGFMTTTAANGAKPAATYTVADQSAWVAAFRIERQTLP
jgi:hypothetical protein